MYSYQYLKILKLIGFYFTFNLNINIIQNKFEELENLLHGKEERLFLHTGMISQKNLSPNLESS